MESKVCRLLNNNKTNMAAVVARVQNYLISTERVLLWHLGYRNPPDSFAFALTAEPLHVAEVPKTSFLDTLRESFLWAVPKHRRSIFRRRQRRFGIEDGYWKMLRPRTNLVTCQDCGGDKEANRLCPTCYAKVKEETEAMQEAIQKELGLSPVDKEVVVLYQGDPVDKKAEIWKGKRIVELKKERPSWFSKNLLQPSTQAPATTTAVEPKDLA